MKLIYNDFKIFHNHLITESPLFGNKKSYFYLLIFNRIHRIFASRSEALVKDGEEGNNK